MFLGIVWLRLKFPGFAICTMNPPDLTIGDDDNDFCRGYGADTNQSFENELDGGENGIDEQGEEQDNEQEEEEEVVDTAPEMPQHFYKDFENFLTREPPKLKDTLKFKGSNQQKVQANKFLPDIFSKQDATTGSMAPPKPPQFPSKLRGKLPSSTQRTKTLQPNFDHNLLREAFAYTDKLLKDAIIEENGGEFGYGGGGGGGAEGVTGGRELKSNLSNKTGVHGHVVPALCFWQSWEHLIPMS